MAAGKITYTDKADRRTTSVDPTNKVVAADMNEIKTKFNALCDIVDQLRKPVVYVITSANFSGSNYQNSELVNKTPMEDFKVFTNGGSGVLIKEEDGGFSFVGATGTLTMTPDNYLIEVYKQL